MLLNRKGVNILPTIENFFEPNNGELEEKDWSGRYGMLLIRCSYRIMLSSVSFFFFFFCLVAGAIWLGSSFRIRSDNIQP